MAKIITDEKKLRWVFDRRIVNFIPSKEEILERFKKGEQFKIYYGLDPTGPDIHLGHVVQLLFLKNLSELGYKPILLIGDFTARIGDPSGKDTTRRPLSEKEIKENMKTYLDQVNKILPPGSFEVKYNSKWLSKLKFEDVLKLASNITVQQTLARDMFQERIKKDMAIGLHEFLYPLMQGYDSVAMEVDGEIGGGDQLFNMKVGRDLEKKYLNKDKMVLGTKLLVDSVGRKMSKSEGNLIALRDSPRDIFGKVMRFGDGEPIRTVYELTTDMGADKYDQYENYDDFTKNLVTEEEKDPKAFKEKVAFELVKMFYDEKEAQKAKEEFRKVFSEKEPPEELEELVLEKPEIKFLDLLEKSGLVSSKSEAKRLVDQGAVQINGLRKENWDQSLILKGGEILKVGPRRFKRIKIR